MAPLLNVLAWKGPEQPATNTPTNPKRERGRPSLTLQVGGGVRCRANSPLPPRTAAPGAFSLFLQFQVPELHLAVLVDGSQQPVVRGKLQRPEPAPQAVGGNLKQRPP